MGRRSFLGPSVLLPVVFFLGAALLWAHWRDTGLHPTTGDEPHYLVIADGLLPTFEIEQSGPYSREFRNKTIYPGGLAPKDAIPDESNTHAVAGPRGLFNVHNLGLPVILAAPYLLFGELGARLTMIAMGAAIVSLLALIAISSGLNRRRVYLTVTPLVFGLPLVPASTQIYPDLPAGLLGLVILLTLIRPDLLTRRYITVLTVFSLAFLPWLHLRFAAISLLGLVAIVWTRRREHSRPRDLFVFGTPLAASAVMLAIYNWYAFGNPAGPYESDDVQTTGFTAMQFFGLLTDQNQGLLMQQPLHLLGLLMLGGLLRRHLVPVVTAAAFALVSIGINSTHWALYGGWSFNGRFGWTALTALSVITLLSLAELSRTFPRITTSLVVVGLLIQSRYLFGLFLEDADLMPRSRDAWVGTYSVFWGTIEPALPVWTELSTSFRSISNLSLVALCVVLVITGLMTQFPLRRRLMIGGTALLSVTTIVGSFAVAQSPELSPRQWNGSALPAEIGSVDGPARIATNEDQPGLLTFGPYWRVNRGEYSVTIIFSASAESDSGALTVGVFDVYSHSSSRKLAASDLKTSGSELQELRLRFQVTANDEGPLDFRTRYRGSGSLTIWSVRIEHNLE